MAKQKNIKASDAPALTQSEINHAATNNPMFADTHVTFGGRKFPVLFLSYDSYIEFVEMVKPMLMSVAGMITAKANLSVPGIDMPTSPAGLTTNNILQFAKTDLPKMAALVLNQDAIEKEDESLMVTPEWVKKNAKSPFDLAKIVQAQISKNDLINEFADFFVQMLPTAMAVQRFRQNSLTAETPSS